ncbi:AAA family ATPase [Kitasatospora viridis]|uniref:Putative kinase n=1 Tax=Kitasatospora viridis TaxID=281105 RepID=A0A561UD65_9ACTN|nr:ATP-binding protein [Kitasatospora viridis]TWF97297.1 putative kinase [Kitasatospora viridis]
MGTVVLMCGLPGAGKSTYALGLVERGYLRLSIDEAVWQRLGGRDAGVVLGEAEFDALKELVRAEQRLQLVESLRAGRNVVVDYSFWSRAARDDYRALADQHGYQCELVYLKADRALLEQRLAVRNRQAGANAVTVGPELLGRYLAHFEEPCGEGELIIEQKAQDR